jgi:hypothetical protein
MMKVFSSYNPLCSTRFFLRFDEKKKISARKLSGKKTKRNQPTNGLLPKTVGRTLLNSIHAIFILKVRSQMIL